MVEKKKNLDTWRKLTLQEGQVPRGGEAERLLFRGGQLTGRSSTQWAPNRPLRGESTSESRWGPREVSFGGREERL